LSLASVSSANNLLYLANQSAQKADFMTEHRFKRLILVVDDDPSVLETLALLLESEGHSVSRALCGPDALALFEPGKFDLVLTDYVMPTMTGDQLAACIKGRSPTQPIVAVTAFTEKLRRVPVPWFDHYIAKPFQLSELRDAIEQYAPAG
jgi:CheY-like chemotaxis protein